VDHTPYDKRCYPIVEVREGYAEWAATYENTVLDQMDLRLLARLGTVDWPAARAVLDLACGTGRIGAWIRQRSAAAIDGVDVTAAMIEVARGKRVYRALHVADVTATGLAAGAYDLCIQSLADEHLADLAPFYREVARLIAPNGTFVIVGYHPQFLMGGVPTHFDRAPGDSITIRSYVHLLSDHVKAARAPGFELAEMDEALVDEAWLEQKPKWTSYRGQPISFAMVWRRAGGAR
jgi:SAM-dependent methyltransferase